MGTCSVIHIDSRSLQNGAHLSIRKQSHYRPGQAQGVLRNSGFPDFVTTAQDGGRLSALRTGLLYPQEILLVLISVRGLVDRKDFMSMKNPLTPAGIEPATFRFVAQRLNHCAIAVPSAYVLAVSVFIAIKSDTHTHTHTHTGSYWTVH